MKQTKRFTIWLNKGLDLTSVPGTQAPAALTKSDGAVLGSRPSLRKRPGFIKIPAVGNNDGVQNAIQFTALYGGAKISELVRIRNGRFEALRDTDNADTQFVDIQIDNGDGTYSDINANITDKVTFEQFNNVLIISIENRAPLYYTIRGYLKPLQIRSTHTMTPPNFFRKLDYRLTYGGIENDRDRLFYSATNNIEDYTLLGGGGAIRFDDGDGDTVGLTGISEKFHGMNFVTKWNHIYQMSRGAYGYEIDQVTDEVGAVSQTCLLTTKRDIYTVDTGGIHSVLLTLQYGAAEEATLTSKIYDYFQRNVNWSAYKNFHLAYDKPTSTLLFTYTSAGSTLNDRVLGINLNTKECFEWPLSPYTAIGKYVFYGRQRTFVHDENVGACILDVDTHTLGDKAINVDISTGKFFPTGEPKAKITMTQAWFLCRPTTKSTEISIDYSLNGTFPITRTVNSFGSGRGAMINDDPDIGGLIGTDFIGLMPNDMAALPFKCEGECNSIEFRIRQEPPENDIDQAFEAYAIIGEYQYEEDSEQNVTV